MEGRAGLVGRLRSASDFYVSPVRTGNAASNEWSTGRRLVKSVESRLGRMICADIAGNAEGQERFKTLAERG